MLFNKSLLGVFGTSACLLMASVAFADGTAAMPQNFEAGTIGATLDLAGWSGYGTYAAVDGTTSAAGVPQTGAATFSKCLAVDGNVEAVLDTTDADTQLDMLVKVAKPDDDLGAMAEPNVRFAIAVDADGKFKYWTGTAWAALCDTVFEEGIWVRVLVVRDATQGQNKYKISLDGNSCGWFTALSDGRIANMKVVGTTAIDDIVLTQTALADYKPAYKDASGNDITVAKTDTANESVAVPLAWFDEKNLATTATDATDGSGMKLADKYLTGLGVTDGSKFEMKSIAMTKDGDAVKATITAPEGLNPVDGATVKVFSKADDGAWDSGTSLVNGQAVITLPAGGQKVTLFKMELVK